jgi:hypothetical protein
MSDQNDQQSPWPAWWQIVAWVRLGWEAVKRWSKLAIERLLYFEDDPSDGHNYMNRRWRYWPAATADRERITIGIEVQMCRFRGVDEAPRVTQCRYLEFIFSPREWRIGRYHIYYDGPHCSYCFGPFHYYSHWGWCLKCMPPENECDRG